MKFVRQRPRALYAGTMFSDVDCNCNGCPDPSSIRAHYRANSNLQIYLPISHIRTCALGSLMLGPSWRSVGRLGRWPPGSTKPMGRAVVVPVFPRLSRPLHVPSPLPPPTAARLPLLPHQCRPIHHRRTRRPRCLHLLRHCRLRHVVLVLPGTLSVATTRLPDSRPSTTIRTTHTMLAHTPPPSRAWAPTRNAYMPGCGWYTRRGRR